MSSGTGFLVSADGAILTAFHIVDGAKSMKAVDVDGRILAAKVVAAQPDIDMALLEVGLASEVYLPVPKELECKLGDEVYARVSSVGVAGQGAEVRRRRDQQPHGDAW